MIKMADAGNFVYQCARDAHAQITQLSDFVSPTIVAMWNLRWQVRGFVAEHPDAKQSDLVARFALGSGFKGNEVKRACVDNSWEDQEERFASILLTNSIAIYEDFVEQLVGLTLSGDAKRRAYKDLQYPNAGGKGFQRAYVALGAPEPILSGVFNSPAVRGRWFSGSNLQNLLICFRFFKETRNALTHNGGRATADLVEAYDQFRAIATETDLSVKEVPQHSEPIEGCRVALSLRGMYGFSDVILRLIATHDANLSDRSAALGEVDRRLGKIRGPARSRVDLDRQQKRIDGLIKRSGFPDAVITGAFKDFLRDTDRIPQYWI